jgi:hypothetical protein
LGSSGAVDSEIARRIKGRTGEKITGNERKRMNTKYDTDTRDTPMGASSWERSQEPFSPSNDTPHHHAARGFGQAFGLHPIPALTALGVNAMLFGGTVLTMGALAPLAVLVAVVLGYITYKSQIRFYGDDHDAALVKSLAVGLLTAIPVGLPAFLTVPSAVVGVVHTLRRKL